MKPSFPGVFQYAYFVDNIEQAATQFSTLLGAGPFFVAKHHKTEQFWYRNEPIEADVSYAFAYAGDAQIQLIEQHDETPSIYRDMFAPGTFGLHHVARLVEDYASAKGELSSAGFELACELHADGVWAAYFDTRSAIHCYTEVHSISDNILATFDRWRTANRDFEPGQSALFGTSRSN
ncbi:MAG: hypothetical protein CBC55_13585 [Gammaproteobacteria bacterium TMED95]|nr:methylmalonyl-CoA epimerase [Gammaproteobacteria bacterium]OUV18897.1 MAG: hypothetical protein CBC55_13585 [Gammaproteobacteria bacterium TMED95]